jgi:hypothetical protein
MSPRSLIILFVLFLAFVPGCVRSGTNPNNNSSAANSNKTASTSSNSGTSNSATSTSSEKIGIAECDEFIAKYNACISDHVPEAQKTQYKENIDAWAKTWRQLVAGADNKPALAAACKRHIDQAREQTKSFGCEF